MDQDNRETGNGAAAATVPTPPQGWASHAGSTVALALPLIGAQLAQVTMNVTDTVMVGWLGPGPLAAAVLATQSFFLLFIFGSGFAQAALPLAANAEGRDDPRGVRRSIRMTLWVLLLYGALVLLPLSHLETILLAFDQAPRTAHLAGAYMRVGQWSIFPALLVMGMRSYLTVIGRAYLMLAVIVIGTLANGLLNYVFIFGHFGAPALGIVGSALATVLANGLMAALVVLYTALAPSLARYELYARAWRADWPAFAEVLRLGWPIGATIIAEVGLFATSSIMMGWLGTIPLAAHGIALQIASISFMVPLGLASAATVRVGVAHGRGDRIALGRAGTMAVMLSGAIAIGAAGLFWLFPERLIGFYLDRANPASAQVLATAVPLLLVAAMFQVADALQAVASGVLRGMKDTRVPMIIALISYWAVGMPVAYLLAFVAGIGGPGIWAGLAAGLATAAIMLNWRYLRRERYGLVG
ncbi:MATE family efflux transporter [Jiella sp. MQZ9-1]|uniref:Multidrug-efflux transporter n=1 Tax=Jiella flava TaxID=2816857 RepID=A0A939JXM4_9HYPH|nr:MATE family efflux transporter [Jiella flava]MBO0664237.1 MATE family efflux transporter [Jiella flava]MCD2472883.1 MATE family efflux transporter [Jiella flava]